MSPEGMSYFACTNGSSNVVLLGGTRVSASTLLAPQLRQTRLSVRRKRWNMVRCGSCEVLVLAGHANSNSQARRLVKDGGVQVDFERVTDEDSKGGDGIRVYPEQGKRFEKRPYVVNLGAVKKTDASW